MKKSISTSVLFPLAIAAMGIFMVCSAQTPTLEKMGGVGMTIFKDKNFQGAAVTYQYDMPNLDGTGFNDEVSSLRVGPGETWQICEHANYQGNCVAVTGEENDLSRNNWNDRISSFRRTGSTPQPPPSGDGSITLYTGVNYTGTPTTYYNAVPHLGNMSDRAQSLTIAGGTWQLCDNSDYKGRCVNFTSNITNLGDYGMANTITSIRPVGGAPPQPQPPPTNDSYVVLYTREDYRGNPTNYNGPRANINKTTASVTIGSGSWELCDGANYRGRCIRLSQSVSDLRGYNIGETIRSLRPAAGPPMGSTEGWYMVLYSDRNYRGQSRNYERARPNIEQTARSVTIGMGVWELCDRAGYRGRCITLSQSVSNLGDHDIGRVIRSVRPVPATPR